jgi:hypothetical protein
MAVCLLASVAAAQDVSPGVDPDRLPPLAFRLLALSEVEGPPTASSLSFESDKWARDPDRLPPTAYPLKFVPEQASTGQQRRQRPIHPLFGANRGDASSRQALDLRLSLSGAYDDNVFASRTGQQTGIYDPRLMRSGSYTAGTAQVSYRRNWRRSSFSIASANRFNYYPDMDYLTGTMHSGQLSFSTTPTRKLTLQATGNASYSPYYGMGAFLAQEAFAQGYLVDRYGLTDEHNLRLGGNAAASLQLTTRNSISGDYYRSQVWFTQSLLTYEYQGAHGVYTHRFTEHLSVRAGYGRRTYDYGQLWMTPPVIQNNIDAGLDYSRALSLTRHTTFSFGTGTAAYTVRRSANTPGHTYFRVTGNANLMREIGRSWTFRADYRRGLQMMREYPEPVFTDQAALSVMGYLGSRVNASISGAYTTGQPGLAYQAYHRFKTYTGAARLQLALNRVMALSGQYLYYHYDFPSDFPTIPGVPYRLNRQAVMLGFDFWVPLLR